MEKEKTRYSNEELQEFKVIIEGKIKKAKKELDYLQEQITHSDGNGTDDTSSRFSGVEDGSEASEKENLVNMASRQISFMNKLKAALVRIENKTYGICRETGKLISKDRLRAVPHATLSIEAKNKNQRKRG